MDGTSDSSEDWGAFGRPLFKDAEARGLSRVGVVDVGSNSVRMVVFDGAARSPAYFYNEKIMCALGAGLADSGILSPEGRVRAVAAIQRFQALAKNMGLPPLTAVATAAVRDATDGPDFCAEVLEKTGLKIWVIDGREEARLSAQGVLLGWPKSYGLVCDIGGASMELAEINDGQVGKCITSDLGPLKLRDLKGGKKGRKDEIKRVMTELHEYMGPQSNRLFLVGGSWRAIARIDMFRNDYPLQVLHEYRMTARNVSKTADFIAKADLDDLRRACNLSSNRIALVPIAAEVLKRLVSTFKPKDIAISSYGIREGMLYEQMPQPLRDRDPLVEACQFAEEKDARFPGFGQSLYKFVKPLFKSAPDHTERLIKAACLLHDVSWRAHPDYRADVCFDNATRANLGGLKHSERVFLGFALMHRYRSSREESRFEDLLPLISPAELQHAEVLGKAMRLGAMLWLTDIKRMAKLQWAPKKKHIKLVLTHEASDLFGEVAKARFASLTSALGATSEVKFLPAGAEI